MHRLAAPACALGLLLLGCPPQGRLAADAPPVDEADSIEQRGLGPLVYCDRDPKRHEARAEELRRLMKEDQRVRQVPWQELSREELREILAGDNERRARVGAIFGEGCLVTAADYAAAAGVFQHGMAPEHSFQTYLFARAALERAGRGESPVRTFSTVLLAKGIDRYLVRTGRRQLFGTQLGAVPDSPCLCQEPVEESFPDTQRVELGGRSLAETLQDLDASQRSPNCQTVPCTTALAPTPEGSIPGLW